MKNIFILFLMCSSFGFSQIQTTTGAGNFFNPLLWDCFCVPANGDTLVINHAMVLPSSIYYNTGQITINSTGSLMEDGGGNRDVWVDGTGSLYNHGVFDCYRLYISEGTFFNSGTSVYFDSLWNQGSISNQGNITAYDFLNDQTGSFNNGSSSNLYIDNNMNNQGYFFNTGIVEIENDFSNCNIQSMDAMFINNNIMCIAADFTNCIDDTLAGSGNYFVAGSSSNFGVFDGTFTFNTPSGTLGVPGNIQAGVTTSNALCGLSIEERNLNFSVYPNPVNDNLYFSEANLSFCIYDISGKLIVEGITQTSGIDVSFLLAGVYMVKIIDADLNESTLKLVKE